MVAATHHVFLLPGFLGIESIGDVAYFAHVREVLGRELAERGVNAEIHGVRTFATSSLRSRVLRLVETIAARADDASPVHLIGHSAGGLDARLFCAPGFDLGTGRDTTALVERVRTIVTIASPHRGTPLATFFTTRFGAQLLGVLSLGTTYVLRFGRLPISVVVRMAALFVRLHGRLGRFENSVVHEMLERMLGDFSSDRRDELSELFKEMAYDQALMAQLMPESMDMFDAAAGRRPGIRCGSVITMAEPVSLHGVLRLGLDPYSQATLALFGALRRLTAEMNEHYLPKLAPEQWQPLERGFGRRPGAGDNDGIVPVLAQLWGEIVHVARADHFDVIGHFNDARHDPPHFDWLASDCRFDRGSFERLWRDVAGFVAQSARPG